MNFLDYFKNKYLLGILFGAILFVYPTICPPDLNSAITLDVYPVQNMGGFVYDFNGTGPAYEDIALMIYGNNDWQVFRTSTITPGQTFVIRVEFDIDDLGESFTFMVKGIESNIESNEVTFTVGDGFNGNPAPINYSDFSFFVPMIGAVIVGLCGFMFIKNKKGGK